jgi:2-desacetyl-2-hydroxyethyl bacteriochlorophyllide A dehydrogenase
MKAVFINKYGSADELIIGNLPMPVPSEHQVLVKIFASSVNPVDWKFRKGDLKIVTGFKFPILLGKDFAGEVFETGALVKNFKPGDKVWGQMGGTTGGAYAEFAAVNENSLGPMPDSLNFLEAASIPLVGLTALQSIRNKTNIKKGNSVLINGAAGGVGTLAIQIAVEFGAVVTGVCGSKNVEFVKSLGAHHVIDYQKKDFSKEDQRYDVILDFIGNYSFLNCHKVLKSNGIYLTATPRLFSMVSGYIASIFSKKKQVVIFAKPSVSDLNYLKDLIYNGKLKPIIDRVFPLSQIAEAHRFNEKGHSRGKIVIDIMSKK